MIPKLTSEPEPLPLYAAFCAELQVRGFTGDLSLRPADRVVLATDNSIYQLRPEAVAFPKNRDDLVRIAKLLAEPGFAKVVVAPRGGGTGTNGQSLNGGLVVDLSRHMNRILEIDPVRRTARVETGVVKDQLNAALKSHGLFFAPELSTSNRATIGGMISTDACGQGSCLYGKTRDHVLELTTVLSDGTVWRSNPMDETQLAKVSARGDLPGAIHSVVDQLQRAHAVEIAERFPKLNRCLTGYDLAHIRRDDGRFDLNSILCGSEGTLGFLAEAVLNLLPIPAHEALVVQRYDSFDAALRDAQALMHYSPASIETVDSRVLALAQGDPIWEQVQRYFPDDGAGPVKGVNLIEFVGDSEDGVENALANLTRHFDKSEGQAGRRGYTTARGAAEVRRLWDMRKKAVGLLGNMKGEKRPIAFVEDTAVPPENLADFIAEFRALLDRRGLDYGMFGHVDAGVLHVRPALDMKAEGAGGLVREITEEVVALTRHHGGLLWGEHGKGMRSEFSPQVFGSLYPVLQAVKAAFDPRNQFNPGKIAAPADEALLRIDGVPTKGSHDRQIPPAVRVGYDEALHCNGNGACFSWDPDEAMCPSWKGTRDRRHSPKGRAQLMRDWLRRLADEGVNPLEEARALRRVSPWRNFPARLMATLRRDKGDFSHQVHEAMSGCLACKSCTGQCPIKVDVPTFRAKFLELYHGRYLRPLRHHAIGRLEQLMPLMAQFPRLVNALTGSGLLRLLGLVHTPKLSYLRLSHELRRRGVGIATPAVLSALTPDERAASVVIVQDAFTSYYEPEVLLAVLDLLRLIGIRPWLAPFKPNGKPLHVHGFLGEFARIAALNSQDLGALASTGVELIGIDPSMTLTYRSEYPAALPGQAVPKIGLIQEWLLARPEILPHVKRPREFRFIPHCTERSTAQLAVAAWQKVFSTCGLALKVESAGCCGMAGTFGHEAEHRNVSERIYSQSWAVHVANAGPAPLLADGFSCRAQAASVDGVQLSHPVQALFAELRQTHTAS
ncbi:MULTISPECIES: FAD-binding and (Fe-S)-binding domain-containing protein [unclassified Sinorhizobium]|uniref:D-2-hydroxyglutarate dehydrogenase YdiJ n=1 Tax=unclassified Sinorhizobium TaxID=2613772 RepID=UPI0024C23BFF|nr:MULTISPECIES: FAD-binding and (Fe-S)-binding domain-containing protein [unclassified Sinorhizobium]MDK1374076.1 FAD-binding and (Fe-S)-binding domain-containing protein [Sinorhizobium sp. 6-70]MDK1480669.1 FAD-binding and (Fe-S)-binding domain-containing protein [Sinorhizobium sp. 6-117]